ncbi:unnamed protein product [Ambrosiozyma monospora]|uniref:Unnamed protein product n=1 Tax=Ambrosiozyma monospora TaxID=43982 RepID=A0ACB5SS15_AMBMO|nr:unnamed protein product [Ambrosiozyma monospora]
MTDSSSSEIIKEIWGYTPSYGANLCLLILWCMVGIVQLILALPTLQFFFGISMLLGCGLEIIGYRSRVAAHSDLGSLLNYMLNYLCLMVAPVCLMAAIYSAFGNVIEAYSKDYSVLKPINYRRIFILLDFLSFCIQIGGSITSASDDTSTAEAGGHVLLGGLLLQVITMFIFMALQATFFIRVSKAKHSGHDAYLDPRYESVRNSRYFKFTVVAMFVSTVLIFVRSIYRVFLETNDDSGAAMKKEAFFLGMDGFMCCIAVALITVFYPGISFRKMRKLRKSSSYSEVEKTNTDAQGNIYAPPNNTPEFNGPTRVII